VLLFASSARQSSAITATKTGWLSNAQTATSTINAGAEPSPTKIFVSTAGRIHGTVTDSAAAPVANATVTLIGGQLRQDKTLQTDSSGTYDSNWIAVGNYAVTVAATGPRDAKFAGQR
jgi:Carboxypeptidase regulatory-like domain